MPHVMGEVHCRHAAGAELALNAIAVLDGWSKSGLQVGSAPGLDHEPTTCCSCVAGSMADRPPASRRLRDHWRELIGEQLPAPVSRIQTKVPRRSVAVG